MFGIGWTEMVLIGILALLVLGPDKLPGIAQQLGKWMRELRAASAGLREEFQQEFNADEWRRDLDTRTILGDGRWDAPGGETGGEDHLDRPAGGFGRPMRRPGEAPAGADAEPAGTADGGGGDGAEDGHGDA